MPRKNKRHQKIVMQLLRLVKDDQNTYFNVKERVPEFQVDPFPRYTPDVHAYVKRSKDNIDVFQVWCGETNEVAVLDLIRCAMIPKVRRLCILAVYHRRGGYNWRRTDVYRLKNALMKMLAPPFRNNLEQTLATGCVLELTMDDFKKGSDYIKKKLKEWYNGEK